MTFVEIAYECVKLQNFNDARSLVACITSAAIARLEKAKALSSQELRDMEDLFGGTNSGPMRIKLATLVRLIFFCYYY